MEQSYHCLLLWVGEVNWLVQEQREFMYFISSDYRLAANGHIMLNARDCFTTWNCNERACQMKDIFGIKKLVPSDRCDSKPGKIKKTVTIMAYTSRASRKPVKTRKCVSCELFHLIWPDKSSPLYSTRKQAGDLQTDLGASADWYIHVSQAYRQEEKFAHWNCIPSPFPYITKNIRPCKSVCFV